MSMGFSVLCVIFLLSAINVRSVKSKVHGVESEDTLSVRVGRNIQVNIGKDGIELEKFKGPKESRLRELLEVSLEKGLAGITYLTSKEAPEKDFELADQEMRKEEDKSRFGLNKI